MKIEDLLNKFDKTYSEIFKKVDNKKELEENQDSYLLDEENSIIGLHFRNIDLLNVYNEIFAIENLAYLIMNNVNFKSFNNIKIECINLEKLSLKENNLSNIPKEILEIKKLKELDLCGNKLTTIPKEILSFKSLIKLNLGNNRLEDIPKDISKLEDLLELDISNNKYYIGFEYLKDLKKLESLNLSSNYDFNEIELEFKSLKSLNLSWSSLDKIPFWVCDIKSLEKLELIGNNLKRLPKRILNLINLKEINLSWNDFGVFPNTLYSLNNIEVIDFRNTNIDLKNINIDRFKNLKRIDLLDLNLKKISTDLLKKDIFTNLIIDENSNYKLNVISNLKNLSSIRISEVHFNQIPMQLFKIKNLISLSLDIKTNKFFNSIGTFNNIKTLEVTSNLIEYVPKEIGKQRNLEHLHIICKRLKKIAPEISLLKKLKYLSIQVDNYNDELFNIKSLKNLQILNLDHCNLDKFPESVCSFKRLERLNFGRRRYSISHDNENKLKTIPDEFINLTVLKFLILDKKYLDSFFENAYSEGIENLQNVLKQKVEQGTDKLFEAKLIFVGEPGAGKSSLMEKILDKNYKLKTKEDEISTIGIDIKNYTFEKDKISFRANLWDFGGQQVQYMSHQFFLTPNSLYLLVGDDRKQNTVFDYWFHIIDLLSNNSPVLVVLNEINHKSITNFDLKSFKERFDEHCIELKDIDLSDVDDGRYEELILKIKNMLFTLPHIGEEIPTKWINIREELKVLSESRYFIKFIEFENICNKYNLDKEDTISLSKHFHNLGVFLHYKDDESMLADTIFLNSKWVMDAIYSVLADKTVSEDNGKFSKEWLFDFWDGLNKGYCDEIKNKLLNLMLKHNFEVCYKINENEDVYISPQLLPTVLNVDYNWNYENNLFYRFQYSFMPKGIISRLIVRMHNFISIKNNKELVWQKGVVLEHNNVKAEIKEKESKEGLKVIDISIVGNRLDSQELLSKIKFNLESIHSKSFKNISYEEMIPCCCSKCVNSENPKYYKFSTLKNYISQKEKYIKCEYTVENVDIGKLLGNILYIDKDRGEIESEAFRLLRELGIMNININKQENNNINNISQNVDIDINITNCINEISSSLSALKRKVNTDEEKDEIDEIIDAFEDLSESPTPNEIKKSGLLSDLKQLVNDFDKNMQETGEVFTKTSKAIKTAKSLGKSYNDLASLCGLPNIPFFLVKD